MVMMFGRSCTIMMGTKKKKFRPAESKIPVVGQCRNNQGADVTNKSIQLDDVIVDGSKGLIFGISLMSTDLLYHSSTVYVQTQFFITTPHQAISLSLGFST